MADVSVADRRSPSEVWLLTKGATVTSPRRSTALAPRDYVSIRSTH